MDIIAPFDEIVENERRNSTKLKSALVSNLAPLNARVKQKK
jgi:hypothetical protein